MSELTEHQEGVLKELLDDKNSIVALTGSGGVGKSFSVAKLVSRLIELKQSVIVTGTTHRSLASLKELDLPEVDLMTIHSFLGLRLAWIGSERRLIKKPKHQQLHCDYLIIDEVSMLTSVLYTHMLKVVEEKAVTTKVILVGDSVQLVIDKKFKMEDFVKPHELTEQMRQKSSKSLVNNLQVYRDKVSKINNTNSLVFDKDFVNIKDHKEFVNEYKNDDSNKIILCYQNTTVSSYNKNIQKLMLKKENHYNLGDNIQLLGPIFNEIKQCVFTNRQNVTITKIFDRDNEKYNNIPSELRDDVLAVEVNDDSSVTIYINLAKTKIKTYLNDLVDQKNWGLFYELSDRIVLVHHIYASTVHSAQGMSIENVYVDMKDLSLLKKNSLEDYNRAAYVAFSRCKNRVVIFSGKERDYTSFK